MLGQKLVLDYLSNDNQVKSCYPFITD